MNLAVLDQAQHRTGGVGHQTRAIDRGVDDVFVDEATQRAGQPTSKRAHRVDDGVDDPAIESGREARQPQHRPHRDEVIQLIEIVFVLEHCVHRAKPARQRINLARLQRLATIDQPGQENAAQRDRDRNAHRGGVEGQLFVMKTIGFGQFADEMPERIAHDLANDGP